MKTILLSLTACMFSVLLMAQPPKVSADKGSVFGAIVSEAGAVSADLLAENLNQPGQSKEVKVVGKVSEVCKAEGCWIRLETKTGSMLVKMKDHSFLVPVALEGKTVVADGVATFKETSVEQLRHFAEDAGKSKKEIDEIVNAKREIVFQATGIKVL